MQKFFKWVPLLAVLMACQTRTKLKDSDEVVLMAYFDDDSHGLKLAYSEDGFKWRRLNGAVPVFSPKVGRNKLFRDPHLSRGPDGGFLLTWTTGWHGNDLGFATSPTLTGWSSSWAIPLMKSVDQTRNLWAPEVYYREDSKEYLAIWSSTVGRAAFEHRIYSATSADLKTFTAPKLFFDPGYSVIDATLASDGGKYFLFFKDERGGRAGINSPGGKKNIQYATSDSMDGPWREVSAPIFGEGATGDYEKAVEGPSVIKVANEWHLYADLYRQDRFALFTAKKLSGPWERVRWKLRMPPGAHHASFMQVKFSELADLEP